MGHFFSDKVETAIRYIYYDLGAQRGQEGFRLLQEACREGDADAYCLLARCLYGQEYTWLGHDFPVDEGAADELIYQSVMMGSALGTLIAMRCGVMNKELQEAMPLASLKTAYDIILEKAKAGDAFCHKVRTSGCHAAVKRAFVPVFAFQHIFVNEAFKSLVAVKILGVNVFYLQKIVPVVNVADNHLAKGIACFRLF